MKYTPELLQHIIDHEFETNHVDFKHSFNWHTFSEYNKVKFAKHLAAMSNIAGGGLLIFGVADKKDICGVSAEDIRSYDRTQVDQFVARYIDPLPQYRVITVPFQNVQLLICEVDEFSDVPCIARAEYEGLLRVGGVYIRSNASSMLIQRASQMRRLIELALRKKKQELLDSIEHILNHEPEDNWKL